MSEDKKKLIIVHSAAPYEDAKKVGKGIFWVVIICVILVISLITLILKGLEVIITMPFKALVFLWSGEFSESIWIPIVYTIGYCCAIIGIPFSIYKLKKEGNKAEYIVYLTIGILIYAFIMVAALVEGL
jgi:hypothetical protein